MPSRSHEPTAGAQRPATTEPNPAPPPTPPSEAARRMRTLVAAFFMLDGFLFANWVVRVPQIKAHVGASPGALGLALLGVSGGAVVTMTVTGRFCTRFGSRPVAVATSALLALSVILPPLTTSVGALGAVLLVLGAGYGGLNVAINSAAVDVVEEIERPIMPMFHAAYSGGGLIGAVAGGVIAVYLSPAWHLTVVGVVGLALTAVLGTMMLRCPPLASEQLNRRVSSRRAKQEVASGAEGDGVAVADSGSARPRASRRVRILVIVFGTIVLCSSYGEGAMADWAALHLRTDLHTGVGLAAAGYASFSIAMVVGRLSGSWLLARLGRTTVLVLGGWLAAGGMVLAALAPVLPLVLVGFVLVGLGLANQFPAVIGRAGALNGPAGVAVASTLGYSGMLAGPPVIGFLADLVGLPIALLSIAALAGSAAVIAVFAARAEASILPGEPDPGTEAGADSGADCAAAASRSDSVADPA
ncbi:MAG TPA: MFS transporter [Actinocrinis sp.]|nr:MFS transporter [Actinocrinis sp.]